MIYVFSVLSYNTKLFSLKLIEFNPWDKKQNLFLCIFFTLCFFSFFLFHLLKQYGLVKLKGSVNRYFLKIFSIKSWMWVSRMKADTFFFQFSSQRFLRSQFFKWGCLDQRPEPARSMWYLWAYFSSRQADCPPEVL